MAYTPLISTPLALPKLMDNEDLQKLGEVYTTFTRVNCADEVLRSFKNYVQVSKAVSSNFQVLNVESRVP